MSTLVMPPRPRTSDGALRRVGVELEMNGIDIDSLSQLVAGDGNYQIEKPGRYERRLTGDAAGDWVVELDSSLVKRLGVEEGMALTPPTFELFLKDDAKGDPFINQSHVVTFGWATAEQLARMQELTLKINDILKGLFDEAGLLLVDFKLEFGLFNGEIVLGDEFSPDGCRLWDKETRKKMDKDRFRQGLGEVIETYEEVGRRLGIKFD